MKKFEKIICIILYWTSKLQFYIKKFAFKKEYDIFLNGKKSLVNNEEFIFNSLFCECDLNRRIPKIYSKKISKGVHKYSKYPAGKTIKFSTNGKKISIFLLYKSKSILSYMSQSGIAGADIYLKQKDKWTWVGCVFPKRKLEMSVRGAFELEEGVKEIVIFLPSYAEVDKIGICIEGGKVIKNKKSRDEGKIVVYGSSITQGCAASRPGLNYANVISRELHKEVINFGFSESAKGEFELFDLFNQCVIDAIVLEYDHNADVKELENTYLPLYKKIREVQAECILICMSRISGGISISKEEEKKRISIIDKTVSYAKETGDKYIVFVPGQEIVGEHKQGQLLADDRHPNDIGMNEIAKKICKVYREIYED